MQMALHNLTKHELIELVEQREVRIAERDRFIAERDQCIVERDRFIAERDRQLDHKSARIFDLEFQVKELQRLIYGSKRERFVSEQSASQLSLGLDADEGEVAQAVEAEIEKITY